MKILMRYVRFRHRRHQFTSLAEYVQRINELRHRRFGISRHERFEQLERAALKSLPSAEFDDAEWKGAKLHPDCYVVIDATYYSVPHIHLLTPMQNSLLRNADKILDYFGGSPCTHTNSAFGR